MNATSPTRSNMPTLATVCMTVAASFQAACAETPTAVQRAPRGAVRAIALPWQEAELRANAAQTIAKILVHEGQAVQQGQLLLEFDRRISLQQRQVAMAAMQGAEAALRQAQLELELADYRHQQLSSAFSAGASTDGEMREASVRRKQAVAAVTAAEHALKEAAARSKLADVEDQRRQLTAPFDGVIMRIDGEIGELSDASQPLLVLADLSKLRVEWAMPIEQVSQTKLGSKWKLAASVPIRASVSGTLVSVEPRMNPITQTVRTVFQIPNLDHWPAGFSIEAVELSAE